MSDKNLRNKIIRLAHAKPELRKDLLPLLQTKKVAYEEKQVKELGAAIAGSENGKAIYEYAVQNLMKALRHILKTPTTKKLLNDFKKGFQQGNSRLSLEKAAEEMGKTLGGRPAVAIALSNALIKGNEKSAGRVLTKAYDKAQADVDDWASVIYDDDGLY